MWSPGPDAPPAALGPSSRSQSSTQAAPRLHPQPSEPTSADTRVPVQRTPRGRPEADAPVRAACTLPAPRPSDVPLMEPVSRLQVSALTLLMQNRTMKENCN